MDNNAVACTDITNEHDLRKDKTLLETITIWTFDTSPSLARNLEESFRALCFERKIPVRTYRWCVDVTLSHVVPRFCMPTR